MRGLSRRFSVVLVAASAGLLMVVPAAQASFGIKPGSLTAVALNGEGQLDEQAGSHPYSYTVHFEMNTEAGGEPEGGELRDVLVDVPPGLVGNPRATPACPREEFEGGTPSCPVDTQIGVLHAIVAGGIGEVSGPVYNVVPPPGVAVLFGFSTNAGLLSLQAATVQSEAQEGREPYGVQISAADVPVPVTEVSETIWGTPAEAGHNAERGPELQGATSEAPLLPYLTLPASCQAPLSFTVQVDSVQDPGHFVSDTAESLDAGGNPAALSGCDAVPFNPSVFTATTVRSAGSASGLDFELRLPDEGLLQPSAVTETEPVRTEVSLPAGVTANPAAANGLAGCSEEQFKDATLESGGCPAASKLGTLVARTPLLEEAIEGSVYIAAQHANPFGSLLALYIIASAPERGVLVKQAGEVQANPVTGQLTAIFDHLPPLPYSSFEFDLREGPRAPLITPSVCGRYTTQAKLYPFSAPETVVERTAPFTIATGAAGGACVASEAQLPNAPVSQAGTTVALAGAYSPLVFSLTREDGSQSFSAVEATLPEGLTGRLAGVEECPQADIERAKARSHEGEGILEQQSPSCPAGSEVGTVTVGVGAGSPLAVQGHAYFAGPYEGAPFSLVIVTPAVAGPFDLGVVVVRAALYVNPITAQITAKSDPIPTILDGLPLDVRSIVLSVERDQFTLNPTSCQAKQITGTETSTLGQDAPLSGRFQVGGCAGLAFKPGFNVSTKAKTSRKDGVSLNVSLTYPSEALGKDANIKSVKVELPKALPSRLSTLQKACTEAQFDSDPAGCPAESVVGYAKALTPILPVPLEGPAYFVSRGAEWPELIMVLQGYGITIDLHGETHISKGVTSSTFPAIPDQPVQSFELTLPEGEHSALAAPGGKLCDKQLIMPASMTAQNGKSFQQATKIQVQGCPTTLSIASHSVKGRKLTVNVYAPAAGKIKLSGNGLTSQSKTAKTRETLKLTLEQKHPGKLTTRLQATFTPKTGKARKKQSKTLTVKFKAPKQHTG